MQLRCLRLASYFIQDLFRNALKKCFTIDASRIDFKLEGIGIRLGLKGKGLAEDTIVLLPLSSFLLLFRPSFSPRKTSVGLSVRLIDILPSAGLWSTYRHRQIIDISSDIRSFLRCNENFRLGACSQDSRVPTLPDKPRSNERNSCPPL